MTRRDEKKIAAAQAKWREQDLRTFGKCDDASMADRRDALLDLLAAHVPVDDAEGSRRRRGKGTND